MHTQSDFEHLHPELMPGEHIIMQLKPNRTAYYLLRFKMLLFNLLRSLPVFLFPAAGIFIIGNQVKSDDYFEIIKKQLSDPVLLIFFGFIFCVLFVFPSLKTLITNPRSYRNAAYFLTNRRVIAFQGNFVPTETSIRYTEIDNVQVKKSTQNTATIYIYDNEKFLPGRVMAYGSNLSQFFALFCLDNGESVAARIHSEIHNAKSQQ